uniref:Uncharacterized protein n=1 Tax=Oryza glumipatula TaxID=40148 RepID=A0A0E0AY37_9ORYZ
MRGGRRRRRREHTEGEETAQGMANDEQASPTPGLDKDADRSKWGTEGSTIESWMLVKASKKAGKAPKERVQNSTTSERIFV